MSRTTVSEVVVDRMIEWGVERVFGYSGDGVNGLLGALARRNTEIEFVQARHEEAAAFMAVGHAKYTRKVGVVMVTQGPGAIHALNGLYDAKLDRVPVVAIVGQQRRSVIGSSYMQEVDLPALFANVATTQLVSTAEQIPHVLDRAFRTAIADSSPSVVILPHDVQNLEASDLPHSHGIIQTAVESAEGNMRPARVALESASEILNAGERVVILVGQGARDAWDQVKSVAERLGAGVVCSLLGKPYIDERLPYVGGTMGHVGTTASARMLAECDTLLIVGSNTPWTEFYPQPGQARAVQIDNDPRVVGDRYPIEVALVGDANLSLAALLELLTPRENEPWRARVESLTATWRGISKARAQVQAKPINPERALRSLTEQIPDNAQISVDVGSIVYWYARQLLLPAGTVAHVSGTLASMGCSVPYALAAKLARSDMPIVALTGDGAMQMLGIAEMITVSRRWKDWDDPRFVVCVLNNGDLAEVTWEQREMEGDPRFAASQDLPRFGYADYAALLGLHGIRVDDPSLLDEAWNDALTADRPTILEIISDGEVPLLPPFPVGETNLESMYKALEKEGDAGKHARKLLDIYVSHER